MWGCVVVGGGGGTRRTLPPWTCAAWTDGALLSAFAGIPTVILGPGDLAVAHSPIESIELAQVIDAARIYAVAATEFCCRRP